MHEHQAVPVLPFSGSRPVLPTADDSPPPCPALALPCSCDRLANTDGTCPLSSATSGGFGFPGLGLLGLPLVTSSKALLFTPASSTTLTSVTLGVNYTAAGSFTVTFTLYQSDPALLTLFPTQVASATFTPTWSLGQSPWKTFNLGAASPAFAVTGGRRYALIVSTTISSPDWTWRCCVNDALPTGLVPGDFTDVDYSEINGLVVNVLTIRWAVRLELGGLAAVLVGYGMGRPLAKGDRFCGRL